MYKMLDVDKTVCIEIIKAIQHKRVILETLIMRTPSGDVRNKLTEANIHLLVAIGELKSLTQLEVVVLSPAVYQQEFGNEDQAIAEAVIGRSNGLVAVVVSGWDDRKPQQSNHVVHYWEGKSYE